MKSTLIRTLAAIFLTLMLPEATFSRTVLPKGYVDERPFRLCTDVELIKNKNEFILAHPYNNDAQMHVLGTSVENFTYKSSNKAIGVTTIRLDYPEDGLIPFVEGIGVLRAIKHEKSSCYTPAFSVTLNDDLTPNETTLFLRHHISTDNFLNKPFLSIGSKKEDNLDYFSAANITQIDCNKVKIIFKEPKTDVSVGSYNEISFFTPGGSHFVCYSNGKIVEDNTTGFHPYIYYREDLSGKDFISTDDCADPSSAWNVLEGTGNKLRVEFKNPAGAEADDIKWSLCLAGYDTPCWTATGLSVDIPAEVPGVYLLTITDGKGGIYEETLTINPNPALHFGTSATISSGDFVGGYKIEGYNEDYHYYWRYSLGDENPSSAPAMRKTAPAGFETYDHETGIPAPAQTGGTLTLAVERNSLMATHDLVYTTVSSVGDAIVDYRSGEELYDLSGRRVMTAPTSGIFLVKRGGKFVKCRL